MTPADIMNMDVTSLFYFGIIGLSIALFKNLRQNITGRIIAAMTKQPKEGTKLLIIKGAVKIRCLVDEYGPWNVYLKTFDRFGKKQRGIAKMSYVTFLACYKEELVQNEDRKGW